MTIVPTIIGTLYVGLKERATDLLVPQETALAVIQSYVNTVGLCVTVTPTQFVYKDGHECGIAVGFINYPRFPSNREQIEQHVAALAQLLLTACKQIRVSAVWADVTEMWTDTDRHVIAKATPREGQ